MAQDSEATIAALQAELAALRVEMQSFAYTVSHDLRAPLRHIVSYTQLVQEDAGPLLSPEVQGFLDTISDSAKHLGAMLDGLLELSRVGTAPVQLTAVPLQAPVHEVVQELARQAAPGRTIDWRIAATLPPVLADATMLRQTLHQVLGNAVKFTAAKDGAVIDISAQVDEAAKRVTLCIQDNGVGFNPAMAQKLFQPFQRLHSTKQFAGLGMGLALVRKQMQRMGGDVSATAQVDGGCALRLVLSTA
jgi:light-regulated signal transduction histidine kinase (bacteriophytochrome)